MSGTAPAAPLQSPRTAFARATAESKLSALLLAGLALACTVELWPQWLGNPDLSHGLLTPLFSALLVYEAWKSNTGPFLRQTARLNAFIAASVATGIGLLVLSALYAAAVGWSHTLVAFRAAGDLAALLTAAWLASASEKSRMLPFDWRVAVAVAAWPLSAPIPPGSYTRLTQHLQSLVTGEVISTLDLLGVAAVRSGNVINLAHATVGVEDACSGIRSLISCVFAGVLLSAFIVKRPVHRTILIALSAPLALAMNFARSLLLTLLADRGTDIRGTWHDVTGFAILGLTAVVLAGLALWFAHREKRTAEDRPAEAERRAAEPGRAASNTRWPERIVLAGAVTSALLVAVFILQTHHTSADVPDREPLAGVLPDTFAGWTVSPNENLYTFSSQLRTRHLVQRTYTRTDRDGVRQVTIYAAYWASGQAPVSLVASHTPDACWPGAGWQENASAHSRIPLQLGAAALPEAEYRQFRLNGYPQNVWYWHFYDGRPVQHEGVGSPRKLLALAWRYGFRNDGPQTFIRISSNRSWEELAGEPLLAEVVRQLQPFGLK